MDINDYIFKVLRTSGRIATLCGRPSITPVDIRLALQYEARHFDKSFEDAEFLQEIQTVWENWEPDTFQEHHLKDLIDRCSEHFDFLISC
jgi:hypothetical protein